MTTSSAATLCAIPSLAVLAELALPVTSVDAEGVAPVIPLSREARDGLSPLGEGVVGEPLTAAPIVEPTRLYHLQPGLWEYRIVAGANRGHVQLVRLEHLAPNDDAT